jgi:hypothetical protein
MIWAEEGFGFSGHAGVAVWAAWVGWITKRKQTMSLKRLP